MLLFMFSKSMLEGMNLDLLMFFQIRYTKKYN